MLRAQMEKGYVKRMREKLSLDFRNRRIYEIWKLCSGKKIRGGAYGRKSKGLITIDELANAFKVSKQRIHQIIRREQKKNEQNKL